ncbi:MAG: hypothetical protein K0S88_1570 [Actinomycetia bacterium]|jgi:hypothetical protein|nr:hypothetical protein [Actinomycetes bacterium]
MQHYSGSSRCDGTVVHCCPQKNWIESTAQGNETKAAKNSPGQEG